MGPLRDLQNASFFKKVLRNSKEDEFYYVPCSKETEDSIEMSWIDVAQSSFFNNEVKAFHFSRLLPARSSITEQDIEENAQFKEEMDHEGSFVI